MTYKLSIRVHGEEYTDSKKYTFCFSQGDYKPKEVYSTVKKHMRKFVIDCALNDIIRVYSLRTSWCQSDWNTSNKIVRSITKEEYNYILKKCKENTKDMNRRQEKEYLNNQYQKFKDTFTRKDFCKDFTQFYKSYVEA